MAKSFASQQSSNFKNKIENIAIVGVSGRSGRFITEALIEGGKHNITAITRSGTDKETLPKGLKDVKTVDYDSHASLVDALRGQDALIITMAVTAPPESQTKLIDAAIDADVQWIMPNEWGVDPSKEQAARDTFMYDRIMPVRAHIEKKGGDKTGWLGLCCGFWYEFSLGGTEARFGFDFEKKTVTFYDEGEVMINTSTWAQVGRGVASLLSLKVLPDNENDTSTTLSQYRNKAAHVSSFFINQKDMFKSVLRVTGDSEQDWKVSHENVQERYKRGLDLMMSGQMIGFGILLYARAFYPDGASITNDKLDNKVLALPEENFDEATKRGIDMALRGETNAI